MDNNKSKVLLSLLAGATAGVVAGLLLAPDSGKNSRASLKNSASKWGGDLDRVFRDGLGRLQEMTGNLTQAASEKISQVKSSADDMFNDFASENSGSEAGNGRKAGSTAAAGSGDSGSASASSARTNPGTSPS